jgi:lysyl-tRNA synthetase class I
VGHEIKR